MTGEISDECGLGKHSRRLVRGNRIVSFDAVRAANESRDAEDEEEQ